MQKMKPIMNPVLWRRITAHFVAVSLILIPGGTYAQTIRYVNLASPCASNCDGATWSQAFKYLQDALNAAQPGDEIRIAAGVYNPTQQSCTQSTDCVGGGTCTGGVCTFHSPREKTFRLHPTSFAGGVILKGGFNPVTNAQPAGTCSGGLGHGQPCSSLVSDCPDNGPDDPGADSPGNCVFPHETILSGDLSGDDHTCTLDSQCGSFGGSCLHGYCIQAGNSENSYHVVTYDIPGLSNEASVLDRVTITGGNANGPSITQTQGGAVNIRASIPGVCDNDPSTSCLADSDCPACPNCPICPGGPYQQKCRANQCVSGGPRLTNCTIKYNQASDHGAVNDHGLDTEIINCRFEHNFAAGEGGALLTQDGTPLVQDCVFVSNASTGNGGAVWTGASTDPSCTGNAAPEFIDCVFRDNQANRRGGALYNEVPLHPCLGYPMAQNTLTLTSGDRVCLFEGNVTTVDYPPGGVQAGGGGAIWSDRVDGIVSHCQFRNNRNALTSVRHGGGAVYDIGSSIDYADCVFDSNTAGGLGGGAMYLKSGVPGFVERCTFRNNSVAKCELVCNGGAIYEEMNNVYIDCVFEGNKTLAVPGDAGAVYVYLAHRAKFINSVFASNEAAQNGGAIALGANAAVTLNNCTIAENHAEGKAGGVHTSSSSPVYSNNTIIWNNTDKTSTNALDQQVFPNTSATAKVSYSCITDDTPGVPDFPFGGEGNIDEDPGFRNVSEGNFRLCIPGQPSCASLSPCVDHGSNSFVEGFPCATQSVCQEVGYGSSACLNNVCNNSVVPNDLDGNDRTIDEPYTNPNAAAIVDMGAYEFCGSCDWYYDLVAPCGEVDVDDMLYVFDAFVATDPCLTHPSANLSPCNQVCDLQATVDVDDILAIINAFSSVFECQDQCCSILDRAERCQP